MAGIGIGIGCENHYSRLFCHHESKDSATMKYFMQALEATSINIYFRWQLGVYHWARSYEAALVSILFVTPSGSSLVMISLIPMMENMVKCIQYRQRVNAALLIVMLTSKTTTWGSICKREGFILKGGRGKFGLKELTYFNAGVNVGERFLLSWRISTHCSQFLFFLDIQPLTLHQETRVDEDSWV